MLIAFMPWNGYNFEDSILISERVVADDRYTSIHIEELVVMARDTRWGGRNHTRHPNLSETATQPPGRFRHHLRGRRGPARRCAGGQGYPEGRNHTHAGRKVAARHFGEKASDVKDTSLRVEQGSQGTVIDVQVFTREGIRATSAPSRSLMMNSSVTVLT